ncbi:aspartate/glutamate racemase family protein [Roseibium suaedae]|uniref:Asp/Glu/hydantoin racemase n=1 Tax=Roseibium suaedae TaxID=735517 RepID=A0A1M7KV82_9HYPH|nr:aspartate/glutamate racemase family protein [Roseibium suaedae]SHM69485.1 Asp/Glu/hydantoin racemase [Roseibium suaedae]
MAAQAEGRIDEERRASRPRVVLINPNTNRSTTSRMVQIAQEAAGELSDGPGGLAIEGATVSSGVPLITNEPALNAAADAVLELGMSLMPDAAGVIVSAFGDPGLDALRRRLSIPVAGIAESSFREAAEGARRFAVVTTTPDLKAAITARVIGEGFGAQFAGVWLTPGDPARLMAQEEALLEALLRGIEDAVRQDAVEAVIIGGGPLAAAARVLAPKSPVPLIEPIPAAVRRMAQMIRARS